MNQVAPAPPREDPAHASTLMPAGHAARRPQLTVIVVSYNTREMTCACLNSLAAATVGLATQVIVVDNASADGSAEAIAGDHPDVDLMALDDNIGFARANNLAAQSATGEFLLLLNPDTIVQNRAIERLLGFAACTPDAGIWGGRTVYADGRLNPASCWSRMTLWNLACRAFGLTAVGRDNPILNGEAYGGWQRDTAAPVDIVSGCFLLIRRDLWQRLDGFDPAFFMYGEDADLCLRARAIGARPMITPDAQIVHYGGASERVRSDKMVRLLAAKSMLIRRHMPAPAHPFALALLAAWPLARIIAHTLMAIASVRPGTNAAAAESWRSVWSRRRAWWHGFQQSQPVAARSAPHRTPPAATATAVAAMRGRPSSLDG